MSKHIRFEQTARRLWCEPWLIMPRMHRVISDVFADHLNRKLSSPGISDLFDPVDAPTMEVQDGVAVIPIQGVISRKISQMERISGATDVVDLSAMIQQAEADPNVKAIVFDVDSPGGGVEGVEETAAQISAMTKPTIAHTSGIMASAAYWLGSAADLVYATSSSTVGSIGVYMAILDEARAYEEAGLHVDLIRSKKTPYKGAGLSGTSLTEEQRADFQAGVDYLYERFSGSVRAARPRISSDAMDGRTFFGSQSQQLGLIDAVAPLEKAISDARKMATLRR